MRVVFLVLLAVLASLGSYAQTPPDVIVNEIHNVPIPQDGEYTEILVVKDNLDMTGWVIGDNNADTDSWQPAIRFSNNSIWRNLRRGTYIVIMHSRTGCEKVNGDDIEEVFDKRAGFIQVCMRNTTYFAHNNNSASMDQNSSGDFIHVVDDDNNHISGIGYDETPGRSVRLGTCYPQSSNWTSLTRSWDDTRPCGPFLFLRSDLENGSSLSYLDSTLAYISSNPGVILDQANTRFGITPTGSLGYGNSPNNIKLMISLRKPDWTAQDGCVEPINSGNKLTWTAIPDPNRTDGAIRYMILRGVSNNMAMPTQGLAYTVGTDLGTGASRATVIASGIESGTITYTDNDPNMPVNPIYRVVAYRYVPTSGITTPDRGPAYNLQDYASFGGGAAAPLPPVEVPAIACDGDTLIFKVNPPPLSEAIYSWKFDTQTGAQLTILDTLNGTTRVVVRNPPARDSIRVWLKAALPALCSFPTYYSFHLPVRRRPSVNVTALDTLAVRGTDAHFMVEVTGTTDLIASPQVNIDTPIDTVSLPYQGGTLTLTVTGLIRNLVGCSATDSASVRERIADSLFYNNIILPLNSDKKVNQTLVITGGVVQNIEIRNRWGKKVLKQSNYANDWRGNSPGTYYFTTSLLVPDATVPIIGFRQVTLKGWVEVL